MEYRSETTRSRDDLIDMLTAELKRIRDKVNELKIQVDQTRLVVDRERQRNNDVFTELRTVQDNLDTIPRQDIRQKYDEAIEARSRFATMSAQLEKLQSSRDQLEQQQTILSETLRRLQGIDMLPSGANSSGGEGAEVTPKVGASMNIVRIIQAQEEERQRLARQMHDGPAQSLTNFILQAEICQRLFDRNPARAAEELHNLKDVASLTFQRVREFIFDLRPMMLDDLGVVPTVRRYVDAFREKNDIEVKLDVFGDERRLESHREVLIFRSIQELIGLARDYANANEIVVRLDMSGTLIKMAVEDDGRGFDAEAAFAGEDGYHDPRVQAFITLREKFELVRGAVSVTSGENEGTAVRLELPAED